MHSFATIGVLHHGGYSIMTVRTEALLLLILAAGHTTAPFVPPSLISPLDRLITAGFLFSPFMSQILLSRNLVMDFLRYLAYFFFIIFLFSLGVQGVLGRGIDETMMKGRDMIPRLTH
jgi:hypothetical protein